MKQFLFVSLFMFFASLSVEAQTAQKSSCSKSKAVATKSCTKAATTAAVADEAQQIQAAVLLTGENVEVSRCATSGNETRSYTCSSSGSKTVQKICGTSGKVTTTKFSSEGEKLSEEIAMLQEGESVTKEAKVESPAASEAAKKACSKTCAKKCTGKKTVAAEK